MSKRKVTFPDDEKLTLYRTISTGKDTLKWDDLDHQQKTEIENIKSGNWDNVNTPIIVSLRDNISDPIRRQTQGTNYLNAILRKFPDPATGRAPTIDEFIDGNEETTKRFEQFLFSSGDIMLEQKNLKQRSSIIDSEGLRAPSTSSNIEFRNLAPSKKRRSSDGLVNFNNYIPHDIWVKYKDELEKYKTDEWQIELPTEEGKDVYIDLDIPYRLKVEINNEIKKITYYAGEIPNHIYEIYKDRIKSKLRGGIISEGVNTTWINGYLPSDLIDDITNAIDQVGGKYKNKRKNSKKRKQTKKKGTKSKIKKRNNTKKKRKNKSKNK
jgi:hypothetical protein